MENDSPFRAGGPCTLITGTTVPGPTPVQLGGPASGDVSLKVWNQGANGGFLVWGPDATTCAANAAALPAAAAAGKNYFLPIPSTPTAITATFTVPPNQFWTVVTLAATSNVYLTPGNGI
jgi:hypothetical protein